VTDTNSLCPCEQCPDGVGHLTLHGRLCPACADRVIHGPYDSPYKRKQQAV
jgi:hypothetical protein